MSPRRRAYQIARTLGIDLSADFHALPSQQVAALASLGRSVGYRAPRNAPGSYARSLFGSLARLAPKHARPVCVVVPRVAPRSSWLSADRPAVDLIVPLDPARRGFVVVWDGCHTEAAFDYLRRTRSPRTPAEVAAADALVKRYRAFVASIPASDRQSVEVRDRLPVRWYLTAWK